MADAGGRPDPADDTAGLRQPGHATTFVRSRRWRPVFAVVAVFEWLTVAIGVSDVAGHGHLPSRDVASLTTQIAVGAYFTWCAFTWPLQSRPSSAMARVPGKPAHEITSATWKFWTSLIGSLILWAAVVGLCTWLPEDRRLAEVLPHPRLGVAIVFVVYVGAVVVASIRSKFFNLKGGVAMVAGTIVGSGLVVGYLIGFGYV